MEHTIHTRDIVRNEKIITIAEMEDGTLPFLRTRYIVCYIPHTGPEIRVDIPNGRITQKVAYGVDSAVNKLVGLT
jgi:hypothetical protein